MMVAAVKLLVRDQRCHGLGYQTLGVAYDSTVVLIYSEPLKDTQAMHHQLFVALEPLLTTTTFLCLAVSGRWAWNWNLVERTVPKLLVI